MKDKAPIYDALIKYKEKEILPFHMPGHKMGRGLDKDFIKNMMYLDLTEIQGMDNLHCPEGIIKESQQLTAHLFGSNQAFYLVNGSSCGIISMIMTVLNPGDKIIIQRNSHKSVIDGIILSGALPVYIPTPTHDEFHITTCVTIESVKSTIQKNLDAKGVILTNPDYFGLCSDIKEIIHIIHSYNMIAMVDEAHGTHFYFNDRLPLNAIKAGADICVNSLHKTLPALTQCALLNVNSHRIDIDRLKFMLQLNQTTSPSYIFLASMDLLRRNMSLYGTELLDQLLDKVLTIRERINSLKNIRCFEEENYTKGISDIDITKLLINVGNAGLNGVGAERYLNDRFNIQIEMKTGNNILLITTISDSQGMFRQLEKAIIKMDNDSMECIPEEKILEWDLYSNIPEQIISPREALYSIMETVDLSQAIGKVCGERIAAYPPGIPIICPGERINEYIVDFIKGAKDKNITLYGIQDNSGATIKILK